MHKKADDYNLSWSLENKEELMTKHALLQKRYWARVAVYKTVYSN